MMEPIFDTSNVLILDSQGSTIMSSQYGVNFVYTTEFETFLASTKDNRANNVNATFKVFKELQIREMDANLLRFYPMNNRSADACLIEYHGAAALVPTSADTNHEYNGLSGIGTVYYTTGIDFKAIITDTDNFTVWIYSQTDSDDASTVDFGSSDGTNFVSISCMSGAQATFKVGTVEVKDTVIRGDGLFFLNVQNGTVKAWQGVERSLTELGTSITMAGILPSEGAFLCALNDTSVVANKSTKRISNLGVYNGLLDDNDITFMNQILEEYHIKNGTSVNYGT